MNRTRSFHGCELNFTTSPHTSPPRRQPTPTLEFKNFRLNAKGAWRCEWEAPVCGADKQAKAHNWIYWSGKNIRPSCWRCRNFNSGRSRFRPLKLPAAGMEAELGPAWDTEQHVGAATTSSRVCWPYWVRASRQHMSCFCVGQIVWT